MLNRCDVLGHQPPRCRRSDETPFLVVQPPQRPFLVSYVIRTRQFSNKTYDRTTLPPTARKRIKASVMCAAKRFNGKCLSCASASCLCDYSIFHIRIQIVAVCLRGVGARFFRGVVGLWEL